MNSLAERLLPVQIDPQFFFISNSELQDGLHYLLLPLVFRLLNFQQSFEDIGVEGDRLVGADTHDVWVEGAFSFYSIFDNSELPGQELDQEFRVEGDLGIRKFPFFEDYLVEERITDLFFVL